MNFELNEAHALLKSSIREFLQKEAPLDKSRPVMEDTKDGFSKELYAKLGDLGYLGLILPESEGGSAAGAISLAVVLEEMGKVAFPGPFLDLVLAAETLSRVKDEQTSEFLQEIVAGRRSALLARWEGLEDLDGSSLQTRSDQNTVRGTKLPVPFGGSADVLLVTAAEGLALFPRPEEGWKGITLPLLDHTQRLVEISLDAPGRLLCDKKTADTILKEVDQLGALGASALLLGLMEGSLELTLDYIKERKAFGRSIGSFQVLQHRAADMWIRMESSRSAVYRAAWAVENKQNEAPLLVASAKAYCGDSARLYGSTRNQLEAALQTQGI
jgi:alkylation response protein AidB-like acyl-CoA dehydrogenase